MAVYLPPSKINATFNVDDYDYQNDKIDYITADKRYINSANNGNDIYVNSIRVGRGGSSILTNTAVGIDALTSNSTGTTNSCFGVNSLYYNTTGIDNTALGGGSLINNTTGSANTGIGKVSIYSNVSGNQNVAVGESSLFSNTGGNQNTALGTSSLANTQGNVNVGVGYNCGSSNTTGIRNTFIGALSNCSTTVSNSTAIGYGTIIDSSNQIKIGRASETTIIDGNFTVNKGINSNSAYTPTTGQIGEILSSTFILNSSVPATTATTTLQYVNLPIGTYTITYDILLSYATPPTEYSWSLYAGASIVDGFRSAQSLGVYTNTNYPRLSKTLVFRNTVVQNISMLCTFNQAITVVAGVMNCLRIA